MLTGVASRVKVDIGDRTVVGGVVAVRVWVKVLQYHKKQDTKQLTCSGQ